MKLSDKEDFELPKWYMESLDRLARHIWKQSENTNKLVDIFRRKGDEEV